MVFYEYDILLIADFAITPRSISELKMSAESLGMLPLTVWIIKMECCPAAISVVEMMVATSSSLKMVDERN